MNFKIAVGLLYFGCIAVRGQENRCDPGVCTSPGLVFNEEMNQCSWADEVGCNVKDLGLDTDCDGVGFHELKAIDFDLKTPSGMDREQFFVVCVPSATEADRALE